MKRGKDEEKMMGPMFPRLHVNDTEKGGPRAPPRNKMALYEQLSIPSQRFSNGLMHHTANNTANSVPPSSQGGGNERGMFFSHQMSPKHQYTDLNTPLDQVEQRKKQDEDDYTVPIFIHPVPSQECPKYTNGTVKENISPLNPSAFNHSSKFQQNKDKDMLERTTRQSSSDRQSTAVLEENISANKRKFSSSSSVRCIPEDDQNIDLSNDSESHEDGSCRSLETGILERAESVSETSILDSESGLDITPDDVVGIIGQKHFWKARRAIANQQRVFAVQLFELHRLIKVQKLVAASPHLLEDSAYLGKPIKPSPRKKLQVEYTIKSIPNISKQKPELEKPSNKKEGSAENTLEKKSLSPLDQNPVPPSPLISTPSNGSNHNATPWCLNQPQGHHWLIPVMSPSEGLVYKPYPGPGFAGPPYGGQNPVMGNFVIPGYGPHHPPPQYQLPSYPLPGPPSYFPHYNMPMMNTSALSGSSVEQMNPPPVPTRPTRFPPGEAHFTTPNLKNGPVSDIEVQASTGSSWSERLRDNPTADVRNMLSLFPTSPVKDNLKSGPQIAESEPARVIRVVPHNARTASESAARIFLSIQEERKQNDSV